MRCAWRRPQQGDLAEAEEFEILFKDRLGQIARAVDLDIFVEPVPPGSPRNRTSQKEREEAMAARMAAEAQVAAAEAAAAERERKKRERAAKKANNLAKRTAAPGASSAVLASESDVKDEHQGAPTPPVQQQEEEQAQFEDDMMTRNRIIRVKVGERPLLVREGYEKESEQIGILLPGQVVTVLEERLHTPGEVRACVALDSITLSTIDGLSFDGGTSSFEGVRRMPSRS